MFPPRVETTLQWINGPKVLDVGCTGHVVEIGSSQWLHGRLREKFPFVTGIDISEENVRLLRQRGFDNIQVQSADAFELGEKFDTIVAGEVIEHLSNPGLFLQHAREHLNPEGKLVITTPNAFALLFISYALFKFPKTCENLEHTCWFCPQTIKELAERSGFRIEHFELFDDYPPASPSWRYRLFVAGRRLFGFVLPKLLAKNRMLLVLCPAAGNRANVMIQQPATEEESKALAQPSSSMRNYGPA
jgi:cyclopropane fatty-acyl-phospholipid synthase-like methyltransferase